MVGILVLDIRIRIRCLQVEFVVDDVEAQIGSDVEGVFIEGQQSQITGVGLVDVVACVQTRPAALGEAIEDVENRGSALGRPILAAGRFDAVKKGQTGAGVLSGVGDSKYARPPQPLLVAFLPSSSNFES